MGPPLRVFGAATNRVINPTFGYDAKRQRDGDPEQGHAGLRRGEPAEQPELRVGHQYGALQSIEFTKKVIQTCFPELIRWLCFLLLWLPLSCCTRKLRSFAPLQRR
jgi:hypothetical protein